MTVPKDLIDRFTASFSARTPGAPRRVGREAEFPVVTSAGDAGDVQRLWPLLMDLDGIEPLVEPVPGSADPLVVGVAAPTWTASVEVGRGTVELSVGPETDLPALARPFEEGLRLLTGAADQLGYRLLGYGIQPKTPFGPELLTPKQRYMAMRDAIGPSWHRFCVTASDQLHIEIHQDELVDLTNMLGSLSGPLIALTANSPIAGNHMLGWMSGRERLMSKVSSEKGRHGAALRWYADIPDYLRTLGEFDCLFLPLGSGFVTVDGSFWNHLTRHPEIETSAAYEAFLFHEHYIWQSARPRARLGTLEMRPACQQPADASWVPAALALGWLENAQDVGIYLTERLGATGVFRSLAEYREAAARRGLDAKEPCELFLATLVDLADKGLRRRGHGEERFLDPVRVRVERRHGPCDVAVEAFGRGGAPAIVEAFTIAP